jgi:hypothetical protein
VCIECMQIWGSGYDRSDPGCIGIPLTAIFGYVVGYIGAHLLQKVWSMLVFRSLQMRL